MLNLSKIKIYILLLISFFMGMVALHLSLTSVTTYNTSNYTKFVTSKIAAQEELLVVKKVHIVMPKVMYAKGDYSESYKIQNNLYTEIKHLLNKLNLKPAKNLNNSFIEREFVLKGEAVQIHFLSNNTVYIIADCSKENLSIYKYQYFKADEEAYVLLTNKLKDIYNNKIEKTIISYESSFNKPELLRGLSSFCVLNKMVQEVRGEPDLICRTDKYNLCVYKRNYLKQIYVYTRNGYLLMYEWQGTNLLSKDNFSSLKENVSTYSDVVNIDIYSSLSELSFTGMTEHLLNNGEKLTIDYKLKGDKWIITEMNYSKSDIANAINECFN